MENTPIIITRTEFFKTSYKPVITRVVPRNFSSLTFRLSGKVSIHTNKTYLVSSANSLTFVPASCEYETNIQEEGEMYIMH